MSALGLRKHLPPDKKESEGAAFIIGRRPDARSVTFQSHIVIRDIKILIKIKKLLLRDKA